MSKFGTETLCHLGNVLKRVKCIQIESIYYSHEEKVEYLLPSNYSPQEYAEFFTQLDDLDYDSGYGSQYFSGTIWYEDGTWSDRREYDGSEWWEHHACPPIPEELI